MNSELPTIPITIDAQSAVAKLRNRSKRGKLPGFDDSPSEGIASVAAHGAPFDGTLYIHHEPSSLRFDAKLNKKIPAIFAVILVLTVWPGLPLTDSFLSNFLWYEKLLAKGLETWMWYVPTTILPLPFVWRTAIKKSRASIHAHALETIEKIRPLLSAND
jgi:hypothetical protein